MAVIRERSLQGYAARIKLNACSSDAIIRAKNAPTRLRNLLYLRYNPLNLPVKLLCDLRLKIELGGVKSGQQSSENLKACLISLR
jgi:hypothetical protein